MENNILHHKTWVNRRTGETAKDVQCLFHCVTDPQNATNTHEKPAPDTFCTFAAQHVESAKSVRTARSPNIYYT